MQKTLFLSLRISGYMCHTWPWVLQNILTAENKKKVSFDRRATCSKKKENKLHQQLKILDSPEDYKTHQSMHYIRCWNLNSKFVLLAEAQQLCLCLEELTPVHGTEPPNSQDYQKMTFAQNHPKAKVKNFGERSPNSFCTRIYQSKLSFVKNNL